jgi:DNA-binding transcriptional LysR family regulator
MQLYCFHRPPFVPHSQFLSRLDHLPLRLNLIAAGLGVAVVAASLQNVRIAGVSFHRLKSAAQLEAPLSLASRRGDSSPVVRQFLKLAKRTAKEFHGEASRS